MGDYRCNECRRSDVPNVVAMAEEIVGPRWWAPTAGLADAQACAVITLTRKLGYCHQHAALIGDLFGAAIKREAARRTQLPGTVIVRYVQLTAHPYEEMPSASARRDGAPLVNRVLGFVEHSQLSAVVELDLDRRRARITFQLHDGGTMNSIESNRLVHITPGEIVTALRDRKSADRTG